MQRSSGEKFEIDGCPTIVGQIGSRCAAKLVSGRLCTYVRICLGTVCPTIVANDELPADYFPCFIGYIFTHKLHNLFNHQPFVDNSRTN